VDVPRVALSPQCPEDLAYPRRLTESLNGLLRSSRDHVPGPLRHDSTTRLSRVMTAARAAARCDCWPSRARR
jgi:hypothetical protein